MLHRRSSCLLIACLLLLSPTVGAEDWTEFRGPGGTGTGSATGLPVKWSDSENLVWKTELPGLGGSSPITLGDRIYLTCYSGYGIEPNEGSDEDLMRHVVCLDRASGKIIWKKDFKPQLPESAYRGGNSARHGYSTSTPATDGERLYVFFGKSGVYCLDLDGKQIWHKDVGSGTHGWGSGASPRLYKDLVIINASVESRSLIALKKDTGEEAWKVPVRGTWNTPVLVEVDGKQELVVSLPQKILAVDPASGKELWTCNGIPDRGYTCPSVVAHDGIVYVIGGRRNTAIAVKAGGRGDVSSSHELWRTDRGSNVSSPVFYKGHLYWVHEGRGVAYCLNGKDGEIVFEQRLRPRPGLVYASITVADGKLYAISQYNGAYVFAAQPEFKLLAHNQFEDEARVNATPVPSGNGRLLLRSDKYLYCVGQK